MADANDVPAHRPMPELRIERGYARDRRGRDLGEATHPLQGRLGQVAIVSLDRLENGYQHVGLASQLLDGPIDEGEVKVRHGLKKGDSPRTR